MTDSLPPKDDLVAQPASVDGAEQTPLHISFPYEETKDTNTARRAAMQQQALTMRNVSEAAFSYSMLWGVDRAMEILTNEIVIATARYVPFNKKLVFREVAKKCLEPQSLNEAIALLEACESPKRADLVKERLTPEIQEILLTSMERLVQAERKAAIAKSRGGTRQV